MEDFRLKTSVSRLQKEVDNLTKEVYTLNQQMSDRLAQIKSLKERLSDGSGK